MTQDQAIDIVREAFIVALMIMGPILIIGLVIGLVISIFQAVTQIQEQTLSFVPKIFGMAIVVIVGAPWIVQQLMDFAVAMFHPE